MQSAEEFARDHLYNVTFDRLSDDTRARDAEWQARVDRATDEAVSQALKVVQASEDYRKLQARVDKLVAALDTVQPYFCDPLFHEEHLKRWPMKNRCPTCGLFVADWDAVFAALKEAGVEK